MNKKEKFKNWIKKSGWDILGVALVIVACISITAVGIILLIKLI